LEVGAKQGRTEMRDTIDQTPAQQRAAARDAALEAIRKAAASINREWYSAYHADGCTPYRPGALLAARERAYEAGCSVREIAEVTREVLG
jgi:hypothetical protein